MDSFAVVLFLVCLAVSNVRGKVDLKKGRVERVSFDGDELVIVVDNSAGNDGEIQMCFASLPEASNPSCPSGFASTKTTIGGYTKREFTLNRQGQLYLGSEPFGMRGVVEFNEDKTLNITVAELPDARTIVTLQNAAIFVPEKPKEDIIVTKKKSNASVKIVAVVVVLILVGLIIGIVVWFCVIRKSKSEQSDEYDDQDNTPKPRGRSSTPQDLSAKMSAKRTSNTTMPASIQPTVCSKQVAHPSPGISAHSPSMPQT